jgi:hypothetical protein
MESPRSVSPHETQAHVLERRHSRPSRNSRVAPTAEPRPGSVRRLRSLASMDYLKSKSGEDGLTVQAFTSHGRRSVDSPSGACAPL